MLNTPKSNIHIILIYLLNSAVSIVSTKFTVTARDFTNRSATSNAISKIKIHYMNNRRVEIQKG